jgi:hypothetical protein
LKELCARGGTGLLFLASGTQTVPGRHFVLPLRRNNLRDPLDRTSQPNSGTRKLHPVNVRRGFLCCSSPSRVHVARMAPLFVNDPETYKLANRVERHIVDHALINIRFTQELTYPWRKHCLVSAPDLHPNKYAVSQFMPSADTGNRLVVLGGIGTLRPQRTIPIRRASLLTSFPS